MGGERALEPCPAKSPLLPGHCCQLGGERRKGCGHLGHEAILWYFPLERGPLGGNYIPDGVGAGGDSDTGSGMEQNLSV